MANLTETSYYARRAINWTILGVIAYLILRVIWGILVAIFLLLFPPKAPPPNHAFGVLPAIVFTREATPSSKITFRLETIQGSVPVASDAATVYFMPKSTPNLLALTRTQQFAERLRLNTKPIQETKNLYRFDDPEFPLRTLRYDIVTNNYTLQYAYGLDSSLFSEGNPPTLERAKTDMTQFLESFSVFPPDFSRDDLSASYLKLVGDQLVKTPTVTQANAIRIDAFRKPIEGLSVYYPKPDEGPVSMVLTGVSNEKKRIISISYTYWPVEYQTKATYKLKPSSEAWQEMQSGLGFIARYPSQGTTAVVRSVLLGYFDSIEPQTYLQPIFVFEGDDGFLGYVSAVAKPWTE